MREDITRKAKQRFPQPEKVRDPHHACPACGSHNLLIANCQTAKEALGGYGAQCASTGCTWKGYKLQLVKDERMSPEFHARAAKMHTLFKELQAESNKGATETTGTKVNRDDVIRAIKHSQAEGRRKASAAGIIEAAEDLTQNHEWQNSTLKKFASLAARVRARVHL